MKYLLFLICLALPAYLIRFSIFNIPTTALEILIYVVFVIGLLNIKKANKIPSAWWWPVGLMLAAAMISVWVSPDKRTALGELKAFFIDPILVFWIAVSYLKADDFKWIIGGLAGSSLIVSGHAIWQKIIGQVTADGRVVGIFGYSPNYLALFLAPITMMLIAYSIEKSYEVMKLRSYEVVGYWLLVLINIIALYFSGSRGGLLALAGGIVFCLIVKFWPIIKTRLWLKIGIGLVIAMSIIATVWVFRPDFSLKGDVPSRVISSNNVRWQIWEASLKLGGKHPVFGVGLGNFQNAFVSMTKDWVNFDAYINPWALSPHNLFFMFWLTTGVLGLVAAIWLIAYGIWRGLKNPDSQKVIFLSALAVIILQGLVDTPYFKNDLSVLFWLIVGGVVVLNKK